MEQARARGSEVFFGTAGWSYPDWSGRVFPRGQRGGLAFLAEQFSLVELNTTFYRPPVAAVAARWVEQVDRNPGFLFTAKLWRGFTHERDFRPAHVMEYRSGLRPLVDAARLGAVLVQLPWSFKLSDANLRHLDLIVREFADLKPVAEFRHRSWDAPRARAWLAERGVGFCNIDQPALDDNLGPSAHVTSDTGYVRLHGRNAGAWFREDAGRDERYDYRYTLAELEPWAERIRAIAGQARRVFVVTNNHFGGSAVANAVQLEHAFRGTRRPLPEGWLQAFPELRDLAPPPAQASLFD